MFLQYISVSSTASSGIMLDPLIPETQNLKTWRDNHQTRLTLINKEKKYMDHDASKVDLALEPILLIADAVKSDNVQRFTVHVRGRILDLAQTYFYMACPKCCSGTKAEYNWEFNCMRCGETHQAKPRNLDVTIFGDNALQLLQMNAITLMEMEKEGVPVKIQEIDEKIKDQMFVMKIKKNIDQRHDGKHIRYSVLNLQEQKVHSDSQRLSMETASSQLDQNKEGDSHNHYNVILIADAIKSNNVSKFMIQVRARIIDKTQTYFYMACPDCYTHTDAHYNSQFTCMHCGEINHAKPREKLLVNVYDDSGDINLIVFGDNAAQIMKINATALMDIETQNIQAVVEAVTEGLKNEFFTIKIKKKLTIGAKKIQYNVISVLPTNGQKTFEEMPINVLSSHVNQCESHFQVIEGQQDAGNSDFLSAGEIKPKGTVVKKLFHSD